MTPSEKRIASMARKAEAISWMTAHGVPPRVPDFTDCSNADEKDFVKLGGTAAMFRAIACDDEAVADAALASLTATEPVVRRQRQPNATEEEIQDAIAQFNAITLRKLGLDPSLATIRTSDELAALRSK